MRSKSKEKIRHTYSNEPTNAYVRWQFRKGETGRKEQTKAYLKQPKDRINGCSIEGGGGVHIMIEEKEYVI